MTYDQQIELLRGRPLKRVYDAWNHVELPIFSLVVAKQYSYGSPGCLTMIRAQSPRGLERDIEGLPAEAQKIIREIYADTRIPVSPKPDNDDEKQLDTAGVQALVDALPVLKEWREKLDASGLFAPARTTTSLTRLLYGGSMS